LDLEDGTVELHEFDRGSRMFPTLEGVGVCSSNSIHLLDSNLNVYRSVDVAPNSQLMGDGVKGVWSLSPVPAQPTRKALKHLSAQNNEWKLVRYVPVECAIIMDTKGGVWVHTKSEGERMHPGLWYLKVNKQKRVMPPLPRDAKLTSDGRGGVFMLCKHGDGSKIWHITKQGRQLELILDCDFQKETKVITMNQDGVYVHCKREGQWALFWVQSNGMIVPRHECPRDGKVVSDRKGSAWIMQRVSRSSSERMVVMVSAQTGRRFTGHSRFPAGTTLGGAY